MASKPEPAPYLCGTCGKPFTYVPVPLLVDGKLRVETCRPCAAKLLRRSGITRRGV